MMATNYSEKDLREINRAINSNIKGKKSEKN